MFVSIKYVATLQYYYNGNSETKDVTLCPFTNNQNASPNVSWKWVKYDFKIQFILVSSYLFHLRYSTITGTKALLFIEVF